MYFEKQKELININMETWKAKLEDWTEFIISWIDKIKDTIEKIAFIESKWYRVAL